MTVVAIGDSITYGFPFAMKDSWVYITANKLKIDIINQGICGDLTKGMLNRFKNDVIKFKPSQVIILGGTNDAYENLSSYKVGDHLKQMVQMSLEHNIYPFLGLPLPCLDKPMEDKLKEYREWIFDYTGDNKAGIIDFYSPFMKHPENLERLLIDGIHPSKEGYLIMAEAVQSILRSCY